MAALVLALAGCGGSAKKGEPATQTVHGPGYTFTAPAGWKRSRKGQTLNVSSGDRILSVTKFTLAGLARPKVAELDRTARELARVLGGTVVSSRAESAGGASLRVYRLSYGKRSAEVAFRFQGRNEFELFCQYRGASAAHCAKFRASFRPG